MSTNARIYLDFNATAPLVPAARTAMIEALGVAGNPSSVHADGRAARDLVETARNRVATLVGRPREEVVFTSGGTEANRLGVERVAAAAIARGLPRVVVTTPFEHPSLRGAVDALVQHGWARREVLDWREADEAGVVAIAASNHELGRLADLAGIEARGWLVHVDAVQLAGKRPLAAIPAAVASIAISAHKIGGPQGSGALVTSLEVADEVEIDAGHQERGRRPGTENTIGIVGFGAAAAVVAPEVWPGVAALGDRLEAGLVALGARINGADRARIGGTINAAFPGVRGESIVIALDLAGISVSTGAACTSGSVKPSPVLLALGQTPAQAREAVRFSLGRTTTADEIERVLAVLPAIVSRARQPSPRAR